MDLIIWGAGASVLGLFLGYLGYLHSKLAYSIFLTSLTVIVFSANYLVELTGGDTLGLADMHSESGQILGFGILRNIMNAINAMGFLPFHVQVSILVFAVAFFIARIVTWARKTHGPDAPEETSDERRQRILKSYGMKSMDELRNRY